MKRIFTLGSLFFICLFSFAQIEFEEGYLIDNNNRRIAGFIKNSDWKYNPTTIQFRLSDNGKTEYFDKTSIKEFTIGNHTKYELHTVDIDTSSSALNSLSENRNPEFKSEELFLKVLVIGNASLYLYEDINKKRFFYKVGSGAIEQLIYKEYMLKKANYTQGMTLINEAKAENNFFRQQILNNLNSANISRTRVEKLTYKASTLSNLFISYNKSTNSDYQTFIEDDYDKMNISIRPRLRNSNLKMTNSISDSRNTVFEPVLGFGLGAEFEFILSQNKNKWGIIIEPTFQRYSNRDTREVDNISGGIQTLNVNYVSVEIPVGVRYKMYASDDLSAFLNLGLGFDLNIRSYIDVVRADNSLLEQYDIKSRPNLFGGIGVKYGERLSAEARYIYDREILSDYQYWNSNFSVLELIVGYNFY